MVVHFSALQERFCPVPHWNHANVLAGLCVEKDGGAKQRFIVDSPQQRLVQRSTGRLCSSGEGFARIEVEVTNTRYPAQ